MSTLAEQLGTYSGEAPELGENSTIDVAQVAPGRPALLETGVLYEAPWRSSTDGMGRHARATVKAIVRAGIAVKLDSTLLGDGALSSDLTPEVRELEYLSGVNFKRTIIRIRHDIFRNSDHLRQILLPSSTSFIPREELDQLLARTVLYTSWERDRVDDDCVAMLNRIGKVWLPCMDNVRAFESSGVLPSKVEFVPFCYDPHEKVSVKGPDGATTFVSSTAHIPLPFGREDCPQDRHFYNIGKWEPRKNQHKLIGAFLLAFKPKDRASLLLKTRSYGKWKNYPTPEESIENWLSDPRVQQLGWNRNYFNRHVRIIDAVVHESEIIELHRRNNIYVSSGHGEAWDLPAFDAKLAGNRLVYTNWGGPKEFAGDDDLPLSVHMVPVDPEYGFGNSQWADVQMPELIRALSSATVPPRRVQNRELYGRFGYPHVGTTIGMLLNNMLENEWIQEGWG